MNVPTQTGPVLVVVSAFERAQFQIDGALASLAGTSVRIELCDGLAAAAWSELLTSVRPEVLVVGWAAPLLPTGYLDAADCPVRYVCYITGSVRRLVPRRFLERGGIVSNWGDLCAPTVAEHGLLLLLAALRRLPTWRPFMDLTVAEQNARPFLPIPTRSLFGRTVSIHGFGLIARQLIRLLAPFNVRVRAHSEGVPPEFMRTHGAEPVPSLAELFAGAEILVEVEALTPGTAGCVNAALLDSLPAEAIFVNIGRGAVVDEAALARRAERGDITVALDVFAVEPLPADSPLRALPDAVLSPHIAGCTRDQLASFGLRAAENLRRFRAGEPLIQPVTLEIYDRST